MASMITATVLDNVVWHAATGAQSALAERRGRAARFDMEVSPFAAVDDPGDPGAWAELAELVGPGGIAVPFARRFEIPPGWSADVTYPGLQMVATDVRVEPTGVVFERLGPQDVDDMLELIAETRPGPFGRRTIELGTYLGLREDGRLVAMAGERFRVPGFTEISAVCTTASHRGRGLGVAAVLAVLDLIRARGDEGFLHVVHDNEPAIALYRKLGFTVRTETDAVVMRNVGGD